MYANTRLIQSRKYCLLLILFTLAAGILPVFGEIATLADDGAWCWFADPRGFYHHGSRERTYIGWITRAGHVQAAQYDHPTNQLSTVTVRTSLQADDHANPSLIMRPDGRIMIFYCRHTSDLNMYYRISTNPEDISSWGEERLVSNITSGNVTYPSVFFLPAENDRLFLFYRGIDWQPTMQTSADGGETWGQPVKIIQIGERPYTKYESDGNGRIHIAFTDGHPRNEPNNSIYHIYYENGAFYRSDGSYIKAVGSGPVSASEATRVYDASQGRGWIWDIALDGGNPVLVYAALPQETQHYYRYARYTGSGWQDSQITFAGGWFPETPSGSSEPEPHYSGGVILDHADPAVVYLSREVNGVFEIERWTTANGGSSWSSQAITSGSRLLNVRPFVPRNHLPGKFDVVWMQGHYVHYTDYATGLKYYNSVAAPPPAPSTRFDFGTSTSPVASGYTRATELTLYTGNAPYGWLDTAGNVARERASGDDLQRDLVFNSATRTFHIELVNGSYRLDLLMGDAEYPHDQMDVRANGSALLSGLSTAAGEWRTSSFSIDVTSGYLELSFSDSGGEDGNWVINAVELTPQGSASLPGDVNSDGQVTIVDALMTAQVYVGIAVSGFDSAAADVNGDGSVTIIDALMIAQFYVGLIDSFPA